jgi:prevent-host-death family protein
MNTDSVAEAKDQLSELIDRALKGEGVVITRHGRPIIELKPFDEPVRAVSAADLDCLATHQVGRTLASEDAGRLVERMRDGSECWIAGIGGSEAAVAAEMARTRK